MKVFVSAALFAVGLAGLSGCASQGGTASADAPKFTEEEKAAMSEEEKLAIYNAQLQEKDRVKCERVQRVGTRLGTRVCSTAAERAAEQESAKEALRRSRNMPAPTGN